VDDLALAVAAARAGARVSRDAFGQDLDPEYKGEVDPVTVVDRRAEAEIIELLHRERPTDAVLAEEGGLSDRSGARRWIIDPLDGTVNYLHGIPHFGVSVSLVDDDGPRVGVTIDVVRGEVFTAERGGGSFCNGVRLQTSRAESLRRSVIVTGFPYDRDRHAAGYAATAAAVLARAQGIRRFGAAVLDFAWVAAGRFDGYWEFSLQPWDQAAGILFVAEAGGIATDHHGDPAHPNAPSIVCAAPGVHAELLEVVAAAVPPHLGITLKND
jgi:myo-inositol-1(or 4)-monophosphatase